MLRGRGGGGQVLGTRCATYPTRGCAYSELLRLRLQSPEACWK